MRNFSCKKSIRSQALIELALVSTALLLLMAAVTDFGISIYRSQIMASAAREGAKSASSASDDAEALFRGLTSARLVCERSMGSNEFFTNGGVIVTALIRYNATNTFFNIATNTDTNVTVGIANRIWDTYGQFGMGTTNGLAGKSKLLSPSETTNSLTRTGPSIPAGLPTNAPDNKKIYCVEVFWTNSSRGIFKLLPTNLYDKAFFIYP